jgi:hypothetical protein
VSNSIGNWNLVDENQGKALDEINPLSSRARSMLVRNRTNPLLKFGFINVTGAIEMLEGLEYHHDNVIRLSSALAAGARISETNVNHEAVAYLNRLGQLFYFSKSEFVRNAIIDVTPLIPTIARFMVFRNKHTAHRSIDAPRPEDTEDLRLAHARAVSSVMGSIFSRKPNSMELLYPEFGVPIGLDVLKLHMQKELWSKNFKTFQTFDTAAGGHVNFTVEIDHPTIAVEAYSVIERVLLFE